jgi:hypothetical protein
LASDIFCCIKANSDSRYLRNAKLFDDGAVTTIAAHGMQFHIFGAQR